MELKNDTQTNWFLCNDHDYQKGKVTCETLTVDSLFKN